MLPESFPDPLRPVVEPLIRLRAFAEAMEALAQSTSDRADMVKAVRTAYIGHLQAVVVIWRSLPPRLHRQWRDTLLDLVSTRLCPKGLHSDMSAVGVEFADLLGQLQLRREVDVPAAKIDQADLVLKLFS